MKVVLPFRGEFGPEGIQETRRYLLLPINEDGSVQVGDLQVCSRSIVRAENQPGGFETEDPRDIAAQGLLPTEA